ncbi:hypothetical protein [Microbacterium sp. Leaf320]|uniref:hypothetical protein n=1 Tax=Microbacterium sp. Leaf320 TaxID=1736334 RepID=UPI0006FFFE6F|nr:hypothetical protein [Microbacterium sp. Leaf320]KQQ65036.1 hypothetical protein ASF63_13775 [Microbacterium sp. Leaf320]
MNVIDSLPLWFWLPPALVGWAWLISSAVLLYRAVTRPSVSPDEPFALDGLEKTGVHRHG